MARATQAPSGKATSQKFSRALELGWTKADDKKISLLNRLIEVKVENGERMMRLEPDPRHVQIALHDLGLDKRVVRMMLSSLANTNYQRRSAQSSGPSRCVFRSMARDLPSALDAGSEGGKEHVWGPGSGKRRSADAWWADLHVFRRFLIQPEVQSLTVKVDSDLAGCKKTRWTNRLLHTDAVANMCRGARVQPRRSRA